METKRMFRAQDGKLIAGVCNGLARYFNVDVVWVRVAFAIGAVMSVGAAFWGYVLLWIVTPTAPEARAPMRSEVVPICPFSASSRM